MGAAGAVFLHLWRTSVNIYRTKAEVRVREAQQAKNNAHDICSSGFYLECGTTHIS